MHEIDKALEQISDIRSRLVVGTTFQGFGPAVVAATGLMALGLGIAQSIWPAVLADSPVVFLACWLVLALCCTVMIGVEMLARSRRIHGGLADAMLVQAVEQFLPAAAAGAMFGFVVFRFAPDLLWTLPGLWQMLLSMGVFASARTLVRGIKLVAAWYFVCALIVFVVSIEQAQLSPWIMALPFFVGQIAAAIILKFSGDSLDG